MCSKMESNFSYLISFRIDPELKKMIQVIQDKHKCDTSTAIRIALINYHNLIMLYKKNPRLRQFIKKELIKIL